MINKEQLPEFAKKPKYFRKEADLSQSALAKKVGISPSHINRIEAGKRNAPKRPTVLKIASELDLGNGIRDQLLLDAGYAPVKQRRHLIYGNQNEKLLRFPFE